MNQIQSKESSHTETPLLKIQMTVSEAQHLLWLLPRFDASSEFTELLTEIRTALDDAAI